MYLDNEKISHRQMKRLIVFNIFSISILIIPRIAVASARRDGLISILIGLVLALIFIVFIGFILKNMSTNFLEYSRDKCGKIITFIVGVFYVIKYFAALVLCGRLFANVINETLLEDTDVRFIILMLLIISAYSASKGLEVRARITELLYFIVLIPIVVFLLVGLKSIDPANLLPLFTEPKGDIIYGGYAVFITFTTLEFLLFSMDNIEDKPMKSKPEHKLNNTQEKTFKLFKNNTLNYILNALVIVGIIDILLYVVTVGTLGVTGTGSKLWSTINMIQIIDLPGGFLQRHDALMISLWMLSIFTLTSGFLYYIIMITKKICNISSQKYVIAPYVILLFAACIIPIDIEVYFWYFEKYMMFIGIPGSIILPLLVLIIGKTKDYIDKRKNKNKNSYKEKNLNGINTISKNYKGLNKSYKVSRVIFLVFLITMSLTLTGCSDMTEIEDRNFIQAMGLDYKNGKISITLEIPDLPAYTDQGSSDTKAKENLITTITGDDFYQIEEEYLREFNKRIDFSHLQVIIFGRNILENKEIYNEFLKYVENKYEISRNTLIFMSDTSAGDIMNMNSKVDKGIGNFLYQLYRLNVVNNGKEEIKLQNLLLSKDESNLIAKVPIAAVKDETVIVKGVGFIQDGLLAYEGDKAKSDFVNIARGFGNNSYLFIEDELQNIKYVLKINDIKQNIKYQEKDNKPFIILSIKGDGDLEKGLEISENGFDKSDKTRINEINQECNTYVKNKILELIEEISKEEHVDFLNLYRGRYKNKNLWLKYQDKPEQFLDDLEYVVEVDIGL